MIKNITSWLAFIPVIILCSYLINSNSFAQNSVPSLENLTESSEIIVVGNVQKAESVWNENKTSIVTKVSIKTSEYLKGKNTGDELFLTVPGGEIGNVGELYTHMPRFVEDEEVLLFMKRGNLDYSIIGGESGKITLAKNEKDGGKIEMSKEQIKELKKSIKNYLVE